MEAHGAAALALDIPALVPGIDVGPDPTPFAQAQSLAAEAWGAKRSWFLVNGASQGNHVAMLALAHGGSEVVVQRNAHSSTIDALILSGFARRSWRRSSTPSCTWPTASRRRRSTSALADAPAAVGALVVSPTYFGAVADVAGLAEVAHARGVPLVVDESWGAHLAFSDELPEHALALGADLVISSVHKHVGSLTQSAIVHVGPRRPDRRARGGPLRDARRVDFAQLPAHRARSTRRAGTPSCGGGEQLAETLRALASAREQIRQIEGLDVLDERLAGAPGCTPTTRSGWSSTCAAPAPAATSWSRALLERDDVVLELAGENVAVAVFGMAEPAGPAVERLVAGAAARGVGGRRAWRTGCASRSPRRRRGASSCSRRARPSSARRRWCRRTTRWAAWPPSRSPPTRPASPTCCPASG